MDIPSYPRALNPLETPLLQSLSKRNCLQHLWAISNHLLVEKGIMKSWSTYHFFILLCLGWDGAGERVHATAYSKAVTIALISPSHN